MKVEITADLLKAISDTLERSNSYVANLKNSEAYLLEGSVGDAVREQLEVVFQQQDMIKGWIHRVRKTE